MTFWFYGTFRSYFDIDHHKTNCVFWTISSICHLYFATQCCTHCNAQVQGTLASHLWDRGSFQYLPRTEVTLLNHSGANFWAATPHCQTQPRAKGSCATGTQPLSLQGKTMLEVRCRATSKPDTCQLLKNQAVFLETFHISSFSHQLQREELKTTRKISLVTTASIWKSTPVSAPQCSSLFLKLLKLWSDITTAHMRFQKGTSQNQPSWKQAATSPCVTQISRLIPATLKTFTCEATWLGPLF